MALNTSAVTNTGTSPVFFDQQFYGYGTDPGLIQAQVDPSQPQVQGLVSVTAPLIPDRHISDRLVNFDPGLFDLSLSSHLTRFLSALLGASGFGGMRKQMAISRMSATLAGTNFFDLDRFWGALFGSSRLLDEQMPTLPDGSTLDPYTDVADSLTWETVTGRDGKFRARIEQLAMAFASGGTPLGMELAATAILNTSVEIIEGWMLDPTAVVVTTTTGNTWQAVESQYTNYKNMTGKAWGSFGSTTSVSSNDPLFDGEIFVIPGRTINEVERLQLLSVLDVLKPSGTFVTVSNSTFNRQAPVSVRAVLADSNDWRIVSSSTLPDGLLPGQADQVYPTTGSTVESARPALSRYTGERWSSNNQVSQVSSYAMDTEGNITSTIDYQTIVFVDGSSVAYTPDRAITDPQRLALARAGADGVMTNGSGVSAA